MSAVSEISRTPLQLRQLELLKDRGNPAAVTELVASVTPAISMFASKFARIANMEQEDLEAEGKIAVIQAIKDFDESRNVVFFTLAYQRIKFHLMNLTKDQRSLVRIPRYIYERGGRPSRVVSLNAPSASSSDSSGPELIDLLRDEAEDPETCALRAHEVSLVREVLSGLSARERDILLSRANGTTLEEIATEYELSRERIRQLEKMAHQKFARRFTRREQPNTKSHTREDGTMHTDPLSIEPDAPGGDQGLAEANGKSDTLPVIAPPRLGACVDLGACSSEELRAELGRALQVTAEHLMRLAGIWKELERRGEDLSDLRKGLAFYLPLIAAGQVDAMAVSRFAGSGALLRAVALMPIEQQRELAQAKTVRVCIPDGPSWKEEDREPEALNGPQIKALFGEVGIRSPAEQRELLRVRKERAEASRAQPCRAEKSASMATIEIPLSLHNALVSWSAANSCTIDTAMTKALFMLGALAV